MEVFKRAAVQIGLRPEQYIFVCMGYSEMVADLTDPAGQCDLASADIGVGSESSHASHQELII